MTRPLAAVVLVAVLTMVGALATPSSALDPRDWQQYQRRFITPDGRVRDTGNHGISHSEGQGYGMLLAEAFGDAVQFARLWQWTQQHLQVRDDHLFAWKWDPTVAGGHITDQNSAADGDILIAFALARAAERWDVPSYHEAARAIAEDVLEHLVRHADAWTVLLPGASGFVHDGVVTVNPSYWVFPALQELDRIAPSPAWQGLTESGLGLLRQGRFGQWQLPPDWLAIGQSLVPAPQFPPVFGYNAVRIPLHLVWGGIDDRELLDSYLAYAKAYRGRPPATIDLTDGQSSNEPCSRGAEAIYVLARWAVDGTKPSWPRLEPDTDYFTASLWMLSKLAYAERSRT